MHPVKALANLHEMYWNIAWNRHSAKDSVLSANDYARSAKQLYINDSLLSLQYHQIRDGKWNHMMSQTHIGYTYWQQPPINKMPDVVYVQNGHVSDTVSKGSFAKSTSLKTTAKPVQAPIFYEDEKLVSMEAEHWTRAIGSKQVQWKVIPDIGKTGSGISTFPVTAGSTIGSASPRVEYEFYTSSSGAANVNLYFSPTLNFYNTQEGLEFAVSIDNGTPQVISLNKEDKNSISGIWNTWVANNIIIKSSVHTIDKPGKHTVKYWAVSPGVVLQKIVVDLGGAKQSYLGPPETLYKK